MKYTVSFSANLKPHEGIAVEIVQGVMHMRYPDNDPPDSLGSVEETAREILDRMFQEGEEYDIHLITDNIQKVDCEPED